MKFISIPLFCFLGLSGLSCSNNKQLDKDSDNTAKPSERRVLLDSAYRLISNDTSNKFLQINKEGLTAAIKTKDTFDIADAYWNYGYYYMESEKLDSSFYYYNMAHKYFLAINEDYTAARMLFNMAVIQNNLNDYTGSEITTFRAIEQFDPEKDHINLYRCYNNLGILYFKLEEFPKSIESHTKAQEYLTKANNKGTLLEGSLNNIGLTYQKQGNHKKAIEFYNQALNSDSLVYKNPNLYAKLLDNRAFNKLRLKDTIGVFSDFQNALDIRDSLKFVSGIVINKIHLSEYFAYKKDTVSSYSLASEAHDLAKSVYNFRDQLVSLKLLGTYDPKNSGHYLADYVQLNDSLQKEERRIRNKFTRIRFETDEYIEQAEKLSTEKQLILIIGVGAVLLLGSLIFIIRQRLKTKQLKLENEQQQDREQIYSLMLEQQSTLAEGRAQERNRISSELHDGILGKMYGTRMNLGFLNIEGSSDTKLRYEELMEEMLHTEKEVRSISHALQDDIFSEEHNFLSIIDSYLSKTNTNKQLHIRISNDPDILWNALDNKIKIHMFRIIQEAFYNTLKYANATQFDINFSMNEKNIGLIIEDNGVGFQIKKSKKGIGQKNMINRVETLGGTIKIASEIDKGTKISITLKR